MYHAQLAKKKNTEKRRANSGQKNSRLAGNAQPEEDRKTQNRDGAISLTWAWV